MKALFAISSSLLLALVAVPARALSDAQIAAIVVTANQVDVDAGRLAVANASSHQVRRFGELMIDDHSGVNRAAVELVEKLGVTPEESPTSRELEAAGKRNLAELGTLAGAAFDKGYIDHEVAYHEQVIDALDQTLIPSAQNDQLKELLVRVRPAFVAHLEHAKQIRSQLEGN